MDKIKKKYFGTDGIRGKANSSSMNAELAINIGMATAEFFTRGNEYDPEKFDYKLDKKGNLLKDSNGDPVKDEGLFKKVLSGADAISHY